MGNSGNMSAANIVAQNTLKELSYQKQSFMSSSEVFKALMMKNDETGLKYPVRGTDGGVVATMPAYNSGFTGSYALASTNTEQAFKIGFTINLSQAAIVGKKVSEEIAMQVNDGLVNAASVFDNAFFYGTGDGTSAFKGLNARLTSASDYAIAASVSSAVNTSAYIVVSGDFDSHLYVPQGLELDSANALTVTESTTDTNGNKMAGKTVIVESYLGFVVHLNSLPAVGQIYYLNGTNYLTYDLFKQLYNAMGLSKNGRAQRATMFVNGTQYRLFSKDCGALITTVQSFNDINLEVKAIDGVRIASTETISNTESNKA